MRIDKKILPEYFQQVADGKKTFELRLNDFDVSEGDTLILKEWDPNTKDYTGRTIEKTVGYVGKWKIEDLTKFYPLEDIDNKGIQVISLKD
jgi:ASC-1-like (ASCH) protein